jgi:nitrogen regulatory protein PII
MVGLTTYDVQGAGVQAGAVERYAGTEFGEKAGALVRISSRLVSHRQTRASDQSESPMP